LIVAEVADGYELVTQGDHAALAAELLALLRLPALVDHPRRALLLRACREHDRGWRGADAAPRVDPDSGRPVDFRSIDDDLRREIWGRSSHEAPPGEAAYVRLLLVLHALYLHRDRSGLNGWDDWLETLRLVRAELLDACGLDPARADADHAWLALADAWSLALCERRVQTVRQGGFEATTDGSSLRLDPFPLAGRTTFTYPCRHLPQSTFATDRELGRALATARWERRAARVGPPEA
jgi:hypothetical protein